MISKKLMLFLFSVIFFSIQSGYSSSFLRLYEPINRTIVENNGIRFSWNVSPYGGNYQVQLSTTNDFTSIIKDTVVNTNRFQTSTTARGLIYWRVKVIGSNFITNWSDVSSFTSFNPADFGDLLIWLDANSVQLNGSKVAALIDKSPRLNNAVQADPTKQPDYIVSNSALSNNPTIKLDGVDDYLQFNRITGGKTFIVLFKHATGVQDYPGVLGDPVTYNFTCESGSSFLLETGAFLRNLIFVNKTPKFNSQIQKPTKFTLMSFIGNDSIAVNHIASDRLVNAGRYWNGEYASVLIFSDTLSETNRSTVEDFLLNRFSSPVLIKDTIVNANLCDSTVIAVPSVYQSYNWNNGSISQSTKFTSNGNYSINAIDIFGQASHSEFSIYPYKRFDNSTVYICDGQTFTTNLVLPTGFTVFWSHNSSNSKTQSFTVSGKYVVKITDNRGCFVYDTLNVLVDKPQLSSIPDGVGELRLCQNEKLFLNTATSLDSIRWSTGSTAPFISVTTGGNYSVYAQTTAGCVINQSFHVTIAGFAPTANFGFTKGCQTSATFFTDSSFTNGSGTINSWKWTLGNGHTFTQQNPIDSFLTLGSFAVALKIKTNEGCSDSISKTIIVNKRPVAGFGNRKSCEGNPTLFQDLSIANAASISNWKWDFAGLGTILDIQNPAFVFPSANNYNVKLVVKNSNGCLDSITNLIKVNQSPISNFSFDAVCGKSPVNFRFLATVPTAPNSPQPTIDAWVWDFGDGTQEGSIKEPSHPYGSPGVYNVKLTVTSSEQCINSIEKQVRVYDFPIVDFDISATQCTGKAIQFTDITQTPDGTPITSWKWYFSGQATDTVQNPTYTFNAEGNYTVQLTASNAVGCSGTKLRSVAVSAPPVPQFTFSPNGFPAPLNVTYTNQSPTNGNYIWDYGDNSALVGAYNPPNHLYQANGTYPITLTATNFRGCTGTITKQLLVGKAYLDGVITSIVLTPNGDYYQIQVTILNGSNIEIRDLGLDIDLGNGSVIRENWTGSLLPGQTTIYNFTGQVKISDNAIPVVCATIDNVNNNSHEDKTDNNTTCKEVRVGSFDVLNIYPNPAYEVINFGVMLPKDGKVSIGFVDMLGQIMYKKDFDGVRGYNTLSMNTMPLNAAVYVAIISFDGEILREKFMRRDRK